MANKAVKLDSDLYSEIIRLIKKPDFKYKYPSISAFINDAVHEKLKESKQNKLFRLKI